MYDNKPNNQEESQLKPSILYVDDEEHNLIAFKAVMRRKYQVFTAISAEEALALLGNNEIEIVISDQRMPHTSGVQFFSKIKKLHPDPIRILLTGYSDMESVVDSINKGEVYRYLTKPWDSDYMISAVNQALELFHLRKENKQLIADLKRVNSQLEFILRQSLLS